MSEKDLIIDESPVEIVEEYTQGPAGAQGAQGDQGAKGDKGDTGATGPAGDVAADFMLPIVELNESSRIISIVETVLNRIDPDATVEGYLKADGTLAAASTSFQTSDYFRVTPGEPLASNCFTVGTYIHFYDIDKVFISALPSAASFSVPSVATIKYCRVSWADTLSPYPVVSPETLPDPVVPYNTTTLAVPDTLLPQNPQFVSDIYTYIAPLLPDYLTSVTEENLNRIDEAAAEPGYILASGAINSAGTSFSTSDYVPVSPGEPLTTNGAAGGSYINYYDLELNIVSTVAWSASFSVPSDSSIAFLRISWLVAAATPYVILSGAVLPDPIVPYGTIQLTFPPNAAKDINWSKLNGLKWGAVGDSITAGSGYTPYMDTIATEFGLVVTNAGIGGAQFTNTVGNNIPVMVNNLATDMDIVTVFAGTNDMGTGQTVGTLAGGTAQGLNTVYGALHQTCLNLISRFPGKPIGFITPCPREGYTGEANSYITAIREVAGYYSIPLLDLWVGSNMFPNDTTWKAAYMPDGIHPNDAGHVFMARRIKSFLLSL